MGVWDTYSTMQQSRGFTIRSNDHLRERYRLTNKMPNSLSFKEVTIYDAEHCFNLGEGNENENYRVVTEASIICTDNLNEKFIITMPEETIKLGSLVYVEDNFWMVTEKETAETLYCKAKLIQCNHLLKWVADGVVYEQWCQVLDGTKYLTGEYEDRNFIAARGDARVSMIISRNSQTVKLGRGNRFLIDDPEAEHKMAFLLTKPLKIGYVYDNQGVYTFVLQEVVATDDDNMELGIADYYKYFPRPEDSDNEGQDDGTPTPVEKRVWL